MSTKAEVLARMADVPEDELVAVPSIWTKAIAEDIYEYATDEEITLTPEQWAKVVEDFENAEHPDDEQMVESIKFVVEGEEA
jgi:hypothetical protein